MHSPNLADHIRITVQGRIFAAQRAAQLSRTWIGDHVDDGGPQRGTLSAIMRHSIDPSEVNEVIAAVRIYAGIRFLPRVTFADGEIILGDELGASHITGLAVLTPLDRINRLTPRHQHKIVTLALVRLLGYVSSGRMLGVGLGGDDLAWLHDEKLDVPWSVDGHLDEGTVQINSQTLEPLVLIRPIRFSSEMLALGDRERQQKKLNGIIFDRICQVLRSFAPQEAIEHALTPDADCISTVPS